MAGQEYSNALLDAVQQRQAQPEAAAPTWELKIKGAMPQGVMPSFGGEQPQQGGGPPMGGPQQAAQGLAQQQPVDPEAAQGRAQFLGAQDKRKAYWDQYRQRNYGGGGRAPEMDPNQQYQALDAAARDPQSMPQQSRTAALANMVEGISQGGG